MILVEVEDNPNCAGCGQMAFNEMAGEPRPIRSIVVSTASGDVECDAAAVGVDGSFGPALARKIDDSGEGPAWLIFGGEWGVRFRRKTDAARPWNLLDDSQWGEAYKVYGLTDDLKF